MAAVERLTAALDTDLWLHLSALADAHADAGDAVMEAGYRWLARLRKFPAGDRCRWFWMYPRDPGGFFGAGIEPDKEGGGSSRMPREVRMRTHGMFPEIGCNPGEFRTLARCYEAGARAVGEWIKEQGG